MLRKFVNSYKIRKFYSNLINKNQLCFDIGANIGKKSRVLLLIGARVIAFEPQKHCLPHLERLKYKFDRFDFSNIALDSKNGTKMLEVSNYSEIATFSKKFINIHNNISWKGKEKVQTITINKAIKIYGLPFYCKIDVEGHEYDILSVLKHKIPLIEFETVAGFQDQAIAIIDSLNYDETLYNYTLNEQPLFNCKKWVRVNEIKKIIASFPSDRVHANIFIKNY